MGVLDGQRMLGNTGVRDLRSPGFLIWDGGLLGLPQALDCEPGVSPVVVPERDSETTIVLLLVVPVPVAVNFIVFHSPLCHWHGPAGTGSSNGFDLRADVVCGSPTWGLIHCSGDCACWQTWSGDCGTTGTER